MADWIDETLIDPETHLVFDGIKAGSLCAPSTPTARAWCGLETELAVRTSDARHPARSGGWSPRSMRTLPRVA